MDPLLCQEFLTFQSKHSFSEGWEHVFFVCLSCDTTMTVIYFNEIMSSCTFFKKENFTLIVSITNLEEELISNSIF